jgi:hypothetical protein
MLQKKNSPFRRVTEEDAAYLRSQFADNTFESKVLPFLPLFFPSLSSFPLFFPSLSSFPPSLLSLSSFPLFFPSLLSLYSFPLFFPSLTSFLFRAYFWVRLCWSTKSNEMCSCHIPSFSCPHPRSLSPSLPPLSLISL